MASKALLLLASLSALQLLLLQQPAAHAFSAFPTTNPAGGVDTTARKRSGRRSFLHRQSRDKPQPIATAEELHALASSLSKRKPGSKSYYTGWIHWRTLAIESIRHDLSRNLPHEADVTRFENLFFRLGVAADVGTMPSFEDAGARSAYAIEFFCRARNLADLYMDALNPRYEFPHGWVEGLMETPMLGGGCGENMLGEEETYSMVSLGGGPGFDYVGAALAASFCSYTTKHGEVSNKPIPIKATILDYQEGWGDLVRAMGNSTRQILQHSSLQCTWGGKCDITRSILDPSNAACLALVNSTKLWACQYCVAENANLLRGSEYIFFRGLFERAPVGCVFVLSEVHPRLWPDFYRLIEEHCSYMTVGFNKNGRQMLLQKSDTTKGNGNEQNCRDRPVISNKDQRLVQKFEELDRYHERKIRSGWQRQERKRRDYGSKQ